MNRWILLVLAALLIPGLAHAEGVSQRKKKSASSWKKEFKKKMRDYDIDVRRQAVDEMLDPEDKDHFEAILEQVLKDGDWSVRAAGQMGIGKVESEDRLEEAIETLKKSKEARIREGIVYGLGLRGDPGLIPYIEEALKDKDTLVRASAALALGKISSKDCIEPLITAMEEKDVKYRVFISIRKGLEELTGKYLGNAPQDWRNWWEGHKDNFELGEEPDEDEIEKAEEAGRKIKDEQKTVAGVRLDFRVKGLGAPLIVLPEFGYSSAYMEEYLDPLSSTAKVYYCSLPNLSAFENLKKGQGDYIEYPVEQLCNAFKEWIAQTKQKKFGLLADQRSCWIAMKFASLHPQNLAQMILLSPASGSDASTKAIQRAAQDGQQRNNPDLQHHAESHLLRGGNPVYQVKNSEEFQKFRRMHFTLWFARQYDTSIGLLYQPGLERRANDIGAPGVVFSGFELNKEKRTPVPTLIIWGRRTPLFNLGDCKKINKFYRNSQLKVFEKSAQVPFIEEHEDFIKLVSGFIKSTRKGKS